MGMRVSAYALCTASPKCAPHASNRAQSVTIGEKVLVSCFIIAMTMRITDPARQRPALVRP